MQKSSLSTLIELAEKALDDAAKNLGKAIRHKEDAENQLNLLIQYQADYENRLQNNALHGVSVSQFANFQAFIGKLDLAIDGQKKIIQDAQYKVEIATKQWQECEKKRLSFDTLLKKNERLQQAKENKRDQKQTDESATRSLFYKR